MESFSARKKTIPTTKMKLSITIPEHYYEGNSDNPASLILEVARTDWKEFAFDIADVVEKALEDQV